MQRKTNLITAKIVPDRLASAEAMLLSEYQMEYIVVIFTR